MSSIEAASEVAAQMAHDQLWPVVILTALLAPILALLTIVVGLASFGASFGLRKMYVKALLKIFQVRGILYYIHIIFSNTYMIQISLVMCM